MMTIQNREAFLQRIANRLGRPVKTKTERPEWKYSPQTQVLNNLSKEELLKVLKEQCQNIHTACYQTTTDNLADTLQQVVEDFGGSSIILSKDERFEKFGLTEQFNIWKNKGITMYEWDSGNPEENIRQANETNIAIVVGEMALAESATIVLYSHPNHGRTLNFLPEKIIVLVPKSSIVPRFTQAAQLFHKQIELGKELPSCILFASGPSNSADIEMVLIVGVHGPIEAAYIIIEDQ